jgi:hypothetical protein
MLITTATVFTTQTISLLLKSESVRNRMRIYMDESGNIISSQEAPFFVLAALVLKESLPIKRCIKEIRKKKIKKKYQRTSELKFNASDDVIKRRVMACIGRTNNDIGYALLCNSAQPDVEPHIIYSNMCKQLVYKIIKNSIKNNVPTGHVEVFIDKALYGAQRAKFDAFLTDKTGMDAPTLGDITIAHADSKACPYIQAVDFIAGAINRKYRDNDDIYYREIQHRIIAALNYEP